MRYKERFDRVGLPVALIFFLLVWTCDGQNLRGRHQKCSLEQEGQIVTVNVHNNFSAECLCKNKILHPCHNPRLQCEEDLKGCHFVERSRHGKCKEQCKGCNHNGTMIPSGQSWSSSEDQCASYHCFSGVTTTSRTQCSSALCPDPIQKPGECCPSCPGRCMRGTQRFARGETSSSIMDPCDICTCTLDGRLICERKLCPALPCRDELVRKIPGQCCPVCSRRHESVSSIKDMCVFKAKVYDIGSKFKSDLCTECFCDPSLTVQCTRNTSCTLSAQRPSDCTFGGSKYSHGQTWTEMACTTCVCDNGETKCQRPNCPKSQCPQGSMLVQQKGSCCPVCQEQTDGVCTVFGDPHYKTFDGRVYNFQGSCKYLLSRDCTGEHRGDNASFSIRITNDNRNSEAFSWMRTVTVRMEGGVKISFLQGMKVKINGKRVKLPFIKLTSFSIFKDGYRIVLRSNTGIKLLWDGVSFLELTVPPKFRNRLCGLCGNFNGNPYDDLYGRKGHIHSNGQEFGDTWRVGGLQACSVLPRDMPEHYEPQCKQSWESKIKSDKNCNALNSNLFSKCGPLVNASYYYNACKLDMCECPGETCHCEVLTAYARECERAGILIHNWRNQTGCLNVSSFQWSGKDLYETVGHDGEASNKVSTHEVLTLTTSLRENEKSFYTDEHVKKPTWLQMFGKGMTDKTLVNAIPDSFSYAKKKGCQNLPITKEEKKKLRKRVKKLRKRLKKLSSRQKRKRKTFRREIEKIKEKLQCSNRGKRGRKKGRGRERNKNQRVQNSQQFKWPSPNDTLMSSKVTEKHKTSPHVQDEISEERESQLFAGGKMDLHAMIAKAKLKMSRSSPADLAKRKPLPLIQDQGFPNEKRSRDPPVILRRPSYSQRHKRWKRFRGNR